ncbi:MAG: serine protease [Armatimonadota bacterium]
MRLTIALGLISLSLLYAQESPSTPKQLLEKIAPSIVTVRVVMKYEFKSGDESETSEQKFSMQGAVVSADGLILLSAMPLTAESLKQMMGIDESEGDERFDFKLTPQSFKVIFGQESKEYEATLVATDSQLGLAFLKIKDLEGRTLTPIQFADTAPTIGQELYTVSRLPKGFDYAPYFSTGRVIGEVSKPRKAYLMEGNISELGLPVYTLSGSAVGVAVLMGHGLRRDDESDFGFSMSFGGQGGTTLFILPASTIKPLIEQAAKRANGEG